MLEIKDFFRNTETVMICPVCRWDEIQVEFEPDIFQCRGCRAYFRNPRPTQAEIVRSYSTGAVYKLWQQTSVGRDKLWRSRLKLIMPYVNSGRLLDIGTGDAHFLSIANKHFTTLGTDINQSAAQYAHQRGHKLLVSPIHELPLDDALFDVITMWHVLEHLPNPGESLRVVFRLLKPKGIFVAAVPNELFPIVTNRAKRLISVSPIGSPFAPPIFGEEIHLTYFIPQTLNSALVGAGFSLLNMGVDDLYAKRTMLNRLGVYGSKLVYHLLGDYHFETAMYVICQKPSPNGKR